MRKARWNVKGLEDMARLAAACAWEVSVGDVWVLVGEMGAGKTSFVREMLRAATGDSSLVVTSPTFTLVQSYQVGGIEWWHYDLFRVKDESELMELGLAEALAGGVVLMEWPEKAEGWLPEARVRMWFEYGADESERRVVIEADAGRVARIEERYGVADGA